MRERRLKLTILLAICVLEAVVFFKTASALGSPEPTAQQRSKARSQRARKPATKYSKFSHDIAQHKIACNSCHKFPTANWNKVRTGEAAFQDVTDYPEHSSCVSCHRKQFFTGAQPVICTICHTNPSPTDSSRHPFPNPPEVFDASPKGRNQVSEFGISFPHDKHVDIVGELMNDNVKPRGARVIPVSFHQDASAKKDVAKTEESDPKSCAVCHKTYQPQGESDEEYVTKPPKELAEDAFWLKKGAFKTSPTHAVCFTCHTPEGLQPTSSDCATCHKLRTPAQQIQLAQAHDDFDPKIAAAMGIKDRFLLEKWSRRDTAKFRHEWAPHAAMSCTTCHTVATLNTMDPKTRTQVKSCGGGGTGCHIETTTDGILNLELQKKKASAAFECSKCHIRNGKSAPPQNHISAIAAATPK
jgi:Outer membrane cytochrome MtrC/MtrF-like, domains II/IV